LVFFPPVVSSFPTPQVPFCTLKLKRGFGPPSVFSLQVPFFSTAGTFCPGNFLIGLGRYPPIRPKVSGFHSFDLTMVPPRGDSPPSFTSTCSLVAVSLKAIFDVLPLSSTHSFLRSPEGSQSLCLLVSALTFHFLSGCGPPTTAGSSRSGLLQFFVGHLSYDPLLFFVFFFLGVSEPHPCLPVR